jgi:hypothetical protein
MRYVALVLAIILLAGFTHGTVGTAPTLTPRTLVGSTPAANGAQLTFNGVAASVAANQSLTSCNITAGDSSGNFSCAASGATAVITTTANAVTNLNANNTSTVVTQNLTVTGTNGSGTSAGVTITVNMYADGSVNAPAGVSAAYSLGAYQTRPPWQVANVDYGVGNSLSACGGSLSDPSTMSVTGVSVNTTTHIVTLNSSSPTIQCFDFGVSSGFSGAGLWTINCNTANAVIKNNNFAVASSYGGLTGIVFGNSSCSNLTVEYNTFDGGGNPTSTTQPSLTYVAPIVNDGSGLTARYNRIKNSTSQNIDIQGGGTLTIAYNSIENSALCCSNHNNYTQFTSQSSNSTWTNPQIIYNYGFQNSLGGNSNPGAGIQVEAQPNNGGHTTITGANVARNVIIAKSGFGSQTAVLNYNITASADDAQETNTGMILQSNYLDYSRSFGPFNIPSGNGMTVTTCSGNINLTTDTTISGTYGAASCS